MKSDIKVLKAIKSTEKFLDQNTDKPGVNENLNFTILGCERRNLKMYKAMLGKDKRKLSRDLKELYQAI